MPRVTVVGTRAGGRNTHVWVGIHCCYLFAQNSGGGDGGWNGRRYVGYVVFEICYVTNQQCCEWLEGNVNKAAGNVDFVNHS